MAYGYGYIDTGTTCALVITLTITTIGALFGDTITRYFLPAWDAWGPPILPPTVEVAYQGALRGEAPAPSVDKRLLRLPEIIVAAALRHTEWLHNDRG